MAEDAIKAFQAAQAALVDALQQDYFCDDLQPPSFAFGWSAEDFKQFYESGGDMVPPPAGGGQGDSASSTAAVPTVAAGPDAALMDFLTETDGLGHLCDALASCKWDELEALSNEGRPALLAKLGDLGLKVPERSKFANAFSKATKPVRESAHTPGGARPQPPMTVAPLYDAPGREWSEILTDVLGYQRQIIATGMPLRANSLFEDGDPYLRLLARDYKPCTKGLPRPTKDGKGVEFHLVEEGWVSGENSCAHGMDLRWFIRPGLEDKSLYAAVRFSERATFAVGLNGSVHGGAIETCIDECTAECAKTKLYPLVLTSSIEVKMKKEMKPNVTYRVQARVDKERVANQICEVVAEITDVDKPDDILASGRAVIVNFAMASLKDAAEAKGASKAAESIS
jgi:acyl-coenzyme A thioesterase PaaI-like protein